MPKQFSDSQQPTRPLKLLALSAAVMALSGMVACSNPSSQAQGGAGSAPVAEKPAAQNSGSDTAIKPVQALRRISNQSERLYGQARRESWGDAEATLEGIQENFQQLKAQAPAENLNLAQLEQQLTRLQTAVTAKERRPAMRSANQTVFAAAQLLPDNAARPTEITLLGYYGRVLDLGGQDEAQTKATIAELRQTWATLRPKVEAKGATDKAQQFNQLVQQAETAQERQDFARVGREIARESREMVEVFSSNSSN